MTLIGAPFTSARAALYPDILTGDRYVLGTAVTLTTLQFAQVIGFAVGGAIVGCLRRPRLAAGGRGHLHRVGADYPGAGCAPRPAARTGSREPRQVSLVGSAPAGIQLVFGSPALRTPMLLGWLVAFYNAPEGIAAPLGPVARRRGRGGGPDPGRGGLGASLGAVGFSRLVGPQQRLRWMTPLAWRLAC